MLPLAKNEFPKCLYLDQNKWIDLAKAYFQRPGGEEFKEALGALREATSSGRLLLPFSFVNALEAMNSEDVARRERLARFMIDLSDNVTILPQNLLQPVEIKNLLRRTFNRGREIPVRPWLIDRGVYHAFGAKIRISGGINAERATEYAHSAEGSLAQLMEMAEDRKHINDSRNRDAKEVSNQERAREVGARFQLPLEQRRAVEVAKLFDQENSPVKELYRTAEAMGIHAQELTDHFTGTDFDFVNFFHSLPTLDAICTLALGRDRDLVRAIEANDIRDIFQLAVAVPYCNLIVLENYWGHQIQVTKLHAKYGTTVITHTKDLPVQLAAMGCLSQNG